jgi:uncharacterized membrane protein
MFEPTLSYISFHTRIAASLTYHRAHHLTSLASRIASISPFTIEGLIVSCL